MEARGGGEARRGEWGWGGEAVAAAGCCVPSTAGCGPSGLPPHSSTPRQGLGLRCRLRRGGATRGGSTRVRRSARCARVAGAGRRGAAAARGGAGARTSRRKVEGHPHDLAEERIQSVGGGRAAGARGGRHERGSGEPGLQRWRGWRPGGGAAAAPRTARGAPRTARRRVLTRVRRGRMQAAARPPPCAGAAQSRAPRPAPRASAAPPGRRAAPAPPVPPSAPARTQRVRQRPPAPGPPRAAPSRVGTALGTRARPGRCARRRRLASRPGVEQP
jgi:hypothetical protein